MPDRCSPPFVFHIYNINGICKTCGTSDPAVRKPTMPPLGNPDLYDYVEPQTDRFDDLELD